MLDRLTCADFEALVGTSFELGGGPGSPVAAELLAAELLAATSGGDGGPRGAGFVLLFRAAAAAVPQGVHPLTHPRLGRLDVFLVPVGREAGGVLLEAVFN